MAMMLMGHSLCYCFRSVLAVAAFSSAPSAALVSAAVAEAARDPGRLRLPAPRSPLPWGSGPQTCSQIQRSAEVHTSFNKDWWLQRRLFLLSSVIKIRYRIEGPKIDAVLEAEKKLLSVTIVWKLNKFMSAAVLTSAKSEYNLAFSFLL